VIARRCVSLIRNPVQTQFHKAQFLDRSNTSLRHECRTAYVEVAVVHDRSWFGSHANLIKLANVDCSLSIGDVMVRDLGVLMLDSELTTHIG